MEIAAAMTRADLVKETIYESWIEDSPSPNAKTLSLKLSSTDNELNAEIVSFQISPPLLSSLP